MSVYKQILYDGITSGKIPAKTKAARKWYRDAAQQISGNIRPGSMIGKFSDKRRVDRPDVGTMYSFRYNPKLKKTLPYYDVFPLVFPIKPMPDGFIGMNFHYLDLPNRAKLMDALYTISSDRRYDENTKIMATYDLLKSASKFKFFKPTVKRYLYSFVTSPFLEITAAEWDIAIFLPMENFKKATKQEVWKDSKGKF